MSKMIIIHKVFDEIIDPSNIKIGFNLTLNFKPEDDLYEYLSSKLLHSFKNNKLECTYELVFSDDNPNKFYLENNINVDINYEDIQLYFEYNISLKNINTIDQPNNTEKINSSRDLDGSNLINEYFQLLKPYLYSHIYTRILESLNMNLNTANINKIDNKYFYINFAAPQKYMLHQENKKIDLRTYSRFLELNIDPEFVLSFKINLSDISFDPDLSEDYKLRWIIKIFAILEIKQSFNLKYHYICHNISTFSSNTSSEGLQNNSIKLLLIFDNSIKLSELNNSKQKIQDIVKNMQNNNMKLIKKMVPKNLVASITFGHLTSSNKIKKPNSNFSNSTSSILPKNPIYNPNKANIDKKYINSLEWFMNLKYQDNILVFRIYSDDDNEFDEINIMTDIDTDNEDIFNLLNSCKDSNELTLNFEHDNHCLSIYSSKLPNVKNFNDTIKLFKNVLFQICDRNYDNISYCSNHKSGKYIITHSYRDSNFDDNYIMYKPENIHKAINVLIEKDTLSYLKEKKSLYENINLINFISDEREPEVKDILRLFIEKAF